ncbi:hypothetical protein G6F68_009700 [Rhizopus microsporus]|nr:hypothetical protein G6F68_009700 [Rhizopus microsporus]
MVAGHRTDVRAGRGPVPGRRLGAVQHEVPGHRVPGRAADLRHAGRAAVRVPQRRDQGHRELQDGRGGCHRRHRPALPGLVRTGLLHHQRPGDPRLQLAGHRLQPVRGGGRSTEPGAGLRLHRDGRGPARAEVHGVVWRIRPDGDPGLAVHRIPAPAVEDPAALSHAMP